ncbi:unnamed protein product, partial [Mesorhabditis spiculigera]
MDTNGTAFRILCAIGLFFLVQFFYVFSKVERLDEGKLTLEAEVLMLERKRDLMRTKLNDLERETYRSEKKLQSVENRLRDHLKLLGSSSDKMPMIYFVTPTHFRPSQRADLTRLSQTLAQVPNLHWIVVEDADSTSSSVAEVIKRVKLPYTHVNAKTPTDMKMKYEDPSWKLPRGVAQRNVALAWIRRQFASLKRGVVYFGDDDNTYDWRLFSEMRAIDRVGIWPVGIVGGLLAETPILAANGSVVGFNAVWKPERPFPIDMAAFAVNISLVVEHPDAGFDYSVPRGFQESHFLTSLGLAPRDLEPKADHCTKVYVWHTRTEKSVLPKAVAEKVKSHADGDFTELEADALGIDL